MTIEADSGTVLPGQMVAGKHFSMTFEIVEDDLPYDITGLDAFIEIRTAAMAGVLLDAFTDASAELTRNDAAGTVTLSIPPDQTRAYTFSKAYIDVLLIGDSIGIRSGVTEIELYRGVTR